MSKPRWKPTPSPNTSQVLIHEKMATKRKTVHTSCIDPSAKSPCGHLFLVSRLLTAIALFTLILPGLLSAAQIYKWVDKDGSVHYSQVPPNRGQIKNDDDARETSRNVRIPVTLKGNFAHCGNLQLPGPLNQPKQILLGLSANIRSWDRALQQSQKSLDAQLRNQATRGKHISQNYTYGQAQQDLESNRRRSTARQIKEYQCALNWADKQRQEYAYIKDEITADLNRAKLHHQATIDKAQQACGSEPRDFSNPKFDEKKAAWASCMRPHDRQIQASELSLNNLRRQANNLQ